jgi:diadenosine tetraphosphatase ApaH/serine/threonine PP2A family protein phosphatase
MRILVISDIHANLVALETVLADAGGAWEQIWCLGDLIGYGPRPNECVALLRTHNHISLSGNHDWAALGKLDVSEFNPEARRAVAWTRSALSAETHAYLDALPAARVEKSFTLAHASPRYPVWEYILDLATAVANFDHFDTLRCLVGHSHVPLLFAMYANGSVEAFHPTYRETIYLEETRVIINPGSVGQPRDGDPRAAYALLDLAEMTWEFHRVAYPVQETQAQMRAADLPTPLIERLAYGW